MLKKNRVFSPLLAFPEATNRMVGGFVHIVNRPFFQKLPICDVQQGKLIENEGSIT